MSATEPPRFGRTPHLVDLVAETERLAVRLRAVPADRRAEVACGVADEATLATLRLDGSPMERLPDLEAAGLEARPVAPVARRGTWLDAMRSLGEAPDEQLQALEALGARAALGSDDLAERLLVDAVGGLEELHRRLTHGLVVAERAGAPRAAEQAVHDASVGRILYFTSDPADVPGELAMLGAWLASAGSREHGLVVSGILHLELLRIHPYDAANGRLARTAARLVLRARGLDPDGLACPEPALAEDPLGYHEEVASTARRRDATIWLERWGEAVTAGLRASLRRLDALEQAAPARATTYVATLEGDDFTVADYRAEVGVGPQDARDDLLALLDAGRVARRPGSRGLRYRRIAGPARDAD